MAITFIATPAKPAAATSDLFRVSQLASALHRQAAPGDFLAGAIRSLTSLTTGAAGQTQALQMPAGALAAGLTGLAGDDVLRVVKALAGPVLLGAGNDRLTSLTSVSGKIDLGSGADHYDGRLGRALSGVFGGDGDDVMLGASTLATRLFGGAGRDQITGGAAADLLAGGIGHDILRGGAGNDTLNGEAGDDHLFAGTGNDVLSGGDGRDKLHGEAGSDRILGGGGDDLLSGGAGNDTLSGDAGRDLLTGDAGDDSLSGGAGDDVLNGGTGNDWLAGGAGIDRLTGGAGADTFVFAAGDGADTILDFDGSVDHLRITGHGSAAQVMDHVLQVGDDLVFDFGGGDRLTLKGCDAGDLAGLLIG